MIEVLETLAAERKAADDDRKQVQTRLQGVSSDVEAVQAQSAKQYIPTKTVKQSVPSAGLKQNSIDRFFSRKS